MSDQMPRVAVITGASQGIGASLATAYRKLGYAVLGTSRTIGPSDDPMIATVQGDIATADTAERVTREAIERFGRIDTLINNAGVFLAKRFTQYTDEEYLGSGQRADGVAVWILSRDPRVGGRRNVQCRGSRERCCV